jgi:hypothetical protein
MSIKTIAEYQGYKVTAELIKEAGNKYFWTEIVYPNGESLIIDGYNYEQITREQAIAEIEKHLTVEV